jgi:tRNA dimethylallyltransferase
MKKIVQILGPTGAGKSKLALALAPELGGEIISADSMQVYRDFNIGTAKLDKEELKKIPHYLIDIFSDCSQYNAAKFLSMSFQVSEDIISRGCIPIVCGGTALYLKTMIRGIFPEQAKKKISREELNQQADHDGLFSLWEKLNRVDPEYAVKISPNDRIRIIRGLEIYHNQGLPPTEIFKTNRTPFQDYLFIRIGLTMGRDELYQRINRRVDQMLNSGLIREVQLLRKKYPDNCPPFKSLGYKEISMHLDGLIDLETATNLIKQHTRNFAKRQLSWFRQERDITWFNPSQFEQIVEWIKSRLSTAGGR